MLRVVMLLIPLLLVGCITPPGSMTPNDQLAVATQSYTEIVTSLAVIQANGGFTAEQQTEINMLILEGRALLDEWHQAIHDAPAGQAPDAQLLMAKFQQTLIEMAAARQEAMREVR